MQGHGLFGQNQKRNCLKMPACYSCSIWFLSLFLWVVLESWALSTRERICPVGNLGFDLRNIILKIYKATAVF